MCQNKRTSRDAGTFVQAAAECVEDNGAGVAVVLVVARDDDDGL